MNLSSSNFYNKKIFIYGLARTGISTLNFLKNKGNKLICWDDKPEVREKISKNFLLIFFLVLSLSSQQINLFPLFFKKFKVEIPVLARP